MPESTNPIAIASKRGGVRDARMARHAGVTNNSGTPASNLKAMSEPSEPEEAIPMVVQAPRSIEPARRRGRCSRSISSPDITTMHTERVVTEYTPTRLPHWEMLKPSCGMIKLEYSRRRNIGAFAISIAKLMTTRKPTRASPVSSPVRGSSCMLLDVRFGPYSEYGRAGFCQLKCMSRVYFSTV